MSREAPVPSAEASPFQVHIEHTQRARANGRAARCGRGARTMAEPEQVAVGRLAGAGLHDAASRVLLDEILNLENLRLT
jgi:hypothetical protein